ncbi:hypothetical protein F5878DRAFT_406044 [Lentinula raphanica]|uniref:Glutamine amidotransferase type-2 domain-containing protein n=1 Tax=Lentinula raphanica TaxID=153919 RepID=A0AA38PGV7_9AGAR|nr:hypothetical protein F5878DRAFT_406044 [Lentinula raphanica]
MCRWIVYIGEDPIMLADLLLKPDHSIVQQVSSRFLPGLFLGEEASTDRHMSAIVQEYKMINVHGFGVTWYTKTLTEFDPAVKDMLPAQYRTIAPISTDLAFKQLCDHTASTCIMAHIRDASFPPVVEVNNHPFIFGKYSFMHNGSINGFSVMRFDVMKKIFELQRIVQDKNYDSSVPGRNYVSSIIGNTDTEHLATLYFAYLDIIRALGPELDNPTDALLLALILTIADIHEIQRDHKVGPFTEGSGSETVGNNLNLCITDGYEQLVATRWNDAEKGYPHSLYLSLTAGEKLNRKYPSDRPEPTESEDIEKADILKVKELVDNYECSKQGCHVIVGSEPSSEQYIPIESMLHRSSLTVCSY